MLRDYDRDPIASLATALREILDIAADDPSASNWPSLLHAARIPNARRSRLETGDQVALDELAAELNENRQLGYG